MSGKTDNESRALMKEKIVRVRSKINMFDDVRYNHLHAECRSVKGTYSSSLLGRKITDFGVT